MNNLLSRKYAPNTLIFLLAVCILVCVVLYFYIGGYSAYDVQGHWRICAYTLEGENPYPLIGQAAKIESLGEIPKAFSTVPWSCVFGSAFYAGYMPLQWACVYIFVLHFAVLALTAVVLYWTMQLILSRKQIIALLLLPCAHFSFMYSVHYGNAGGVICCLLMIAFCIGEKRPILAGILVGLGMMKPQITAIVCFALLLNKQWKTLFVAAGIVVTGWAATSLMTSVDPLTLLKQTFSSGTSPTQYLGLLNNLKYGGVNSTLILLMNVAIGCGYTAGLHLYLKKNGVASMFVYVPACIASVFWVYKNGTDYLIVTFAAVFFALLCMKKVLRIKEYVASVLCIGILEMSRCAVYLGVMLFEDNLFIRDLFKSAEGLVLAIVGIYLCRLWVRHKGDAVLIEK